MHAELGLDLLLQKGSRSKSMYFSLRDRRFSFVCSLQRKVGLAWLLEFVRGKWTWLSIKAYLYGWLQTRFNLFGYQRNGWWSLYSKLSVQYRVWKNGLHSNHMLQGFIARSQSRALCCGMHPVRFHYRLPLWLDMQVVGSRFSLLALSLST